MSSAVITAHRPVQADEQLDHLKQTVLCDETPRRILQGWKALGYTHLMVFSSGAAFLQTQTVPSYAPQDWEALEGILRLLLPPQDFHGFYQLDELP